MEDGLEEGESQDSLTKTPGREPCNCSSKNWCQHERKCKDKYEKHDELL